MSAGIRSGTTESALQQSGADAVPFDASGLKLAAIPDALITQAKLALDASSIGVGQDWQDVTGSRAISTTYYNTTGKPIFVSVTGTYSAACTIDVDGATAIIIPGGNYPVQFVVLVPAGSSYALTGWATLTGWTELR